MHFPFSAARLRIPQGFEKKLRKLLKKQPDGAPSLPPAANLLIGEAPFLYNLLLTLKKDCRCSPALPLEGDMPRILLVARDMVMTLPLKKGPMLQRLLAANAARELESRELACLPCVLTLALMEQVGLCLSEVLAFQPEKDALALQEKAAKTLEALHRLPRMRLDAMTEHVHPVATLLRRDNTYPLMDRQSRQYYLNRTAFLARKWHVAETAVARAALTLCEGKEGVEKEAGYYLTEKPALIARHLLKRQSLPGKTFRSYSLPLFAAAVLFSLLFVTLRFPLLLLPCALLAFSEHARTVYYRVLRRLFPARLLPRLSPRQLTDKRLLVVIPTLLTEKKQAWAMVQHMRALRAATPHAHFMLLADFADSTAPLTENDRRLMQDTAQAFFALPNEEKACLFYLQRGRAADTDNRLFTGRERKRGALEGLNKLLCGETCPDEFLHASLPLDALAHAYDHVITLDADTFLPPGAAIRLQGALEHPLQKGRIAVIQPRMDTLSSSIRTRTQRLFSPLMGVDGYQRASQNVYQDVFGRGSFAGKGIYNPALFLEKTEGRLPEGRILSHDLIEGEWAGAAMAEDIVFFDSQPSTVSGWQKRLHRWTRGDWQLLPFLKDKRLSALSRWKIYDNLRASLVPAAEIVLLLAGAWLQNPFLTLLGLPFPARGLFRRLWVLPGKAVTQLDAAFRALYRLYVSKTNLLSWVTASQTEGAAGIPASCTLSQLFCGACVITLSLLPGAVLPGLVPGVLFLTAPLFVRFVNAAYRPLPGLTETQKNCVHALCRDTWHFFEKNVHTGTFHLPPDNVQLQPEKGPALRTSPTNIGLYLLSLLAARELKLITTAQMARRMLRTVETLEHMEKWQGHLFNWYDLNDLSPLPPRFVSTVDSGNLCACLLCCAQGAALRSREMDDNGRTLPRRLEALARAMRFDRLYDPGLSQFHIGLDADTGIPTTGHYDLLASECRLCSYVAVMLRQIPLKHWFSLGRPTVRQGGGTALLSWGGTAFEYLMPALLLPLYPDTLLQEGCFRAIRAQIAAAHHRPFGISESGYFAFDPDMQYQYRTFGLPALAMKQDTQSHVVAPYASMLALPFFPRAAIRNLQRMRQLSWYSEEGLMEAADYAPRAMEKGPLTVQSHMAHHQGMILCAACNLLTDFSLVRRFMAAPAARAYSFLLCESLPPRPALYRPLPKQEEKKAAPSAYRFSASPGFPLSAHALAGSGVTWLMNSQGSGFLKCGQRYWTRFHDSSPSGPQFYLRNRQTGACIHPQSQGNILFENGCIRIPVRAFQLQGEMRLFVMPLNGMAVADFRLENRHTLDAEIELISFLEVAQNTLTEDRAHPHFQDLSVRVEPLGSNTLVSRRLTNAAAPLPLLVHTVRGDVQAVLRQGDRLLFLGRQGNYTAPEQTGLPPEKCRFRTGDVLAPCLSLRCSVRIRPGQSVHVQFLTFEAPLDADIPMDGELLADADVSLAPLKDAMTLTFLQLDPAFLPLYSRMLGSLCFPGQPHQAHKEAIPLRALWPYGLSGRENLCTVYLQKADKPLIRHALLAHALFRTWGVECTLIFVCEKSEENYLTPLQDCVHALMHTIPAGCENVIVTAGSRQNAANLACFSRLFLESGLPLEAQLDALSAPAAPPLARASSAPAQTAPPLFLANKCGGFTQEMDYCITAPPPAPWHNILMGQRFGTLTCENAILHSFCDNSQLGRITRAAPDVHRPEGAEQIFLSDTNGHTLSLLGGTAIHRPGCTEYHTRPFGLRSKVTVFSHAHLPVGLRTITLQTEKDALFTLRCTVHFALGRVKTGLRREEEQLVLATGSEQDGCAFAWLSSGTAHVLPAACLHTDTCLLPNSPGGEGVVFLCPLSLKAHMPLSLTMAIGCAHDAADARKMVQTLRKEGAAACLRQAQAFWQNKLEKLLAFGLDDHLTPYINRWLPYQALCARLMARTGPYQAGGAFGFRDQLQDLLCCLHTDEEAVRRHLLLCAAHQYREGDVQHWWHPSHTGVRTRISDDRLFLPFMTALYVQVSGDRAILDEQAPFLVSPPLKPQEKDRYETPSISRDTASLQRHCLLAMNSVVLGPRGIPRMGSGDWNDGLSNVQGESVWLGFFLCMVYQLFAPLCDEQTESALLQKRSALLASLEEAWTGKWYLRAWYDTGEPLAGPDTQPPRIDLISQCFACLAGAPREHARLALHHALLHLHRKAEKMVLLLHPPFTPKENAGYIGAYLPGVRENGGQYTHALPWLVMALCNTGQYGQAWQIAREALPLFHTANDEGLMRYQLEPYVLCGDVYAGENRGRGGWSWYTGSAAWLYYVFVTELLGLEKRGNRLRLTPCPGGGSEEFTLVYRWRSACYHLTAAPQVLFPTLDGERLKDGWVTLSDDGKTHEARFPLRNE